MKRGDFMGLSSFEKFSGVYCSGSFIKNSSAVTALSLLFEELYIPNNLELAIEFAKHYRFIGLPESIQHSAMSMSLQSKNADDIDPLQGLTQAQQEVVKQYYMVTQQFFIHYNKLVGPFIKTDIVKSNDIFDVQLIKRGKAGEKNTYKVSLKPLMVSLNENNDGNYMEGLLSRGAVPVICDKTANIHRFKSSTNKMDINAQSLACILAMKSIELIIPPTKPADSDTILEARYKLRDLLPPFWSSMLKLSVDLRKRVSNDMPIEQIMFEGKELVDTTVLPALIELKQKLRKEHRDWFHKIIYPVADGIKLLIGNSKLTPEGLMRAGLYSSLDIIDGAYSQKRAVDLLKLENGLTYLLELDKTLDQ